MDTNSDNVSKCPVTGATQRHSVGSGSKKNRDWWPNQLKLNMLRQHSSLSNPMGKDFNYAVTALIWHDFMQLCNSRRVIFKGRI